MKRKIYTFITIFLFMGIVFVIGSELGKFVKKRHASKNDNKTVETMTDASVSDASSSDAQQVDAFSYAEIESMMMRLSSDEEKTEKIRKLVGALNKSEKVTVDYINSVAEVLGISESDYHEFVINLEPEQLVSKESFLMIYNRFIEKCPDTSVSRKNMIICQFTGDGKIYDGNQYYNAECEIPEKYLDKVVEVYEADGTVFYCTGLSNGTATVKNVYVSETKGKVCTFSISGITKHIPVATDDYNGKSGKICDLTFTNDGITLFSYTLNLDECRIAEIDEKMMKREKKSYVSYDEDILVYAVADEIRCYHTPYVLAGVNKVKLYLDDSNKVVAAVINNDLSDEIIRVVLCTNDFTSYEHKSVSFVSTGQLEVKYPDDVTDKKSEGVKCQINAEDFKKGDVITVTPSNGNDRIQITSLQRNCGAPQYRGVLKIYVKDGYLYLVNELPLEEYLYGVVSSEILVGEEQEALRAFAVCSRSYAYAKIKSKSFDKYNADLDDSSFCQNYNSLLETDESISAVDSTYGIVASYDGKLVIPFYFATSPGITCTNADVYGGNSYGYYVSRIQDGKVATTDLSEESTFVSFMSSDKYDCFEKDLPWYRWEITYSYSDMNAAVSGTLLGWYNDGGNPNVLLKNQWGNYARANVETIGELESITVVERSKSGTVQKLEIVGSEATVLVCGQNEIRTILTPVNQVITKNDGTTVTGWNSLPSPFYYITKSDGNYVIYGGGFGQGVGMSFEGADVLAIKGYKFDRIIRQYFVNSDLVFMHSVEDSDEEGN